MEQKGKVLSGEFARTVPPARLIICGITMTEGYDFYENAEKDAARINRKVEAMLSRERRLGRAEGWREAVDWLEHCAYLADDECDICGHIPEKKIAGYLREKAASLESGEDGGKGE